MTTTPFLVLSLIAAAAIPGATGPAPATSDEVKLVLQSIRDVREVDLRSEAERGGMSMSSEPGLELLFHVALPDGTNISHVTQPARVQAKDSAGTDLGARPADMFGNREFLSSHAGFGDANSLRLRLASTARKADTFSAQFEASMIVYSGVEPHDVAQAAECPLHVRALGRFRDDRAEQERAQCERIAGLHDHQ